MDEVKPKVYSSNLWTSKMLEMSYPKTNKGLSSLWTRDSASYKSNLWTSKASKGNTIHRRVILVKFKEW